MSEIDWGLLKPAPDIVGTYQNAFRVGQGLAKEAQTRQALSTYATDPQGSVNAMMAVDPDRAMQMQQYGQQQSDRTARIAGAQAYAAGDVPGAKAALAQTGDLNGAVALDQHIASLTVAQQEAAAKRSTLLGNVAGALLNVPLAQRPSVIAHMAPDLQAQGIKPEEIQGFDLSDGSLSSFRDMHMTVAERLTAAAQAETARHNKVEETMPKAVAVGADQTLVNTNPNSPGGAAAAAPAAGGAPPPAAGPQADQIAQTAKAAGATPEETAYLGRTAQLESSASSAAQNGSSTGLFQFHPDTFHRVLPGGDITSPVDQTKAALALSRQDRQTLQKIGVAPDDANAYIMHQQGAGGGPALLKADPNANAVAVLTPVYGNADLAKKAITGNGGTPDMTAGQFVQMWRGKFAGGAAPTPTAGAPAAAAPAGNVMFQGANVTSSQAAQSGKTGADFLATLPAGQQNIVKSLAEGRLAFPSGAALKSPYWQNILQSVAAYDPTFDAVNYGARSKLQADFLSTKPGSSGGAMVATNTAINHLLKLSQTADALQNTQIWGIGNTVNSLKNALSQNSGNPAVTNFNSARQVALTEVAKLLQGGPPHQGELAQAEKNLSDAQSPAQLHGAIQTLAELIGGKVDPLVERYRSGMGPAGDRVPGLSPASLANLQKLRTDGKPASSSAGATGAGGFKVLGVQ